MPDLEGHMHSFAPNPEPESVFVVCCAKCEEQLFVGNDAFRHNGGIICDACWYDWQSEQTEKHKITLEHDSVTDGS